MSNGFNALAPIDNNCFNCRYRHSGKDCKHCTPYWTQGNPSAVSYSKWKPRTWWQEIIYRLRYQ